MVEFTEPCQRLYLAKGAKEDIYVETAVCLPQHQYDGIRFLYKQFRKGKAGVIMNDPSGYGKRVQTVLFIDAIRPIMTLPVLVLCTEGKEQLWVQLFQQWTKLGPDVSVQNSEAEAPHSACVVSAARRAGALGRRAWAVLVLDERAADRDAAHSANYKIWITSLDMKKNLQTFSLIYKFLNPRERFIVEDFEAIKKTPTMMLTRSIKLDAFMEDIVLRRRDVHVSLGKCTDAARPAVITRKNKDSTGKRIKRSKPAGGQELHATGSHNLPILGAGSSCDGDAVIKNGKIKNTTSIDEFIVNIKSAVQTIMEVDFINTAVKVDEQGKSDEMEIEFNNVNHVPEHDYKQLSNESIDSQNIVIKYDSDTPDDEIQNVNIPTRTINNPSEVTSSRQIESEPLFSTGAASGDIKSESKLNTPNQSNIANASIEADRSSLSASSLLNEVKNEIVEVKTDDVSKHDNELVNKSNVSKNKKTDGGVEMKIKEMEELVMKKFMGSTLDSLFQK